MAAPATGHRSVGDDGTAPSEVLPVSAPANPSDAPAPTPTPATAPSQVSIPALAHVTEPAPDPVQGTDDAGHALLAAPATQSLPQKVANNRSHR